MVQMSAADQMVVKSIPGNIQCADCGMKSPQWASVSFGTVFCLECSGVHRSLGVHISFVRSIAMDSWTDPQLKLMKAGGNAKCAAYLREKGVDPNTPIKAKYESPAAQLYKEVLKARAEGRPEPTQLPKPAVTRSAPPSMGGAPSGVGKPGEDPNGMERLTGETEQQYVVRQTRLKEQARARMASKFGNSGSMGGVGSSSGRMGGIGSDSSYDPSRGGYGGGGPDVDSIVSGIGSAWTTSTRALGSATQHVSALVSDEGTQQAVSNLAGSVKSTGASFWNSLSSSVSAVAQNIAQPDAGDDGLFELQREMQSKASVSDSKYAGFGSSNNAGGSSSSFGMNNNSSSFGTNNSNSSFGMNNNSSAATTANGTTGAAVGLPGEDPNGVAALTGETDAQYVARQTRIREEAKARMAAKFGGGGLSSASSSSNYNGGGSSTPSRNNSFAAAPTPPRAPSSGNAAPVARTSLSAPSSGNMLMMNTTPVKPKLESSDDFFSSFGA